MDNVISKPWYTSWTVWINVLSVIAAALVAAGDQQGQLQLTTQQVAAGAVVLAVVNAAIRILRTNQPISGSPSVASLSERYVLLRRRRGG